MLLLFQSIIIYGFIIGIMMFFGKIAYKSQYPNGYMSVNRFNHVTPSLFRFYFAVPIFIFCFFAAIRFQVGVDCESYKDSFYELVQFGQSTRGQEIEIGFKVLVDFTSFFTNKHYFLFFILALLQISLYFFSFRKETQVLWFFSLALFLTGEYWSWMNGMRQIIAACSFVACIPLILDKKWLYASMIVLVASFIHRSALLIIPIGIIAYLIKEIIPNKYIQIVILVFCFVFMNYFNDIIDSLIALVGSSLGYNESKITSYEELEATQISFGLRSFLLYSVYLLIVLFSDKMRRFFSSNKFNICYNLFFISICLTLLFYNNFAIIRILYYVNIFVPAIVSYFLFYSYYNRKSYPYLFPTTLLLLLGRTVFNFYSVMGNSMESILYKFDL